jgi:hypothetical protein
MKKTKPEETPSQDIDPGRSAEELGTVRKETRGWEVFARQADREAQRYYDSLAMVIRTADEGLRNKRVSSVGRAYLARIVTEAKTALGKEFGLVLRDDTEIPLGLTNRSLN